MDYNKHIYELYIKDISKYELLTKEEERELIKRKDSGCKKSRDLLINSNLRIVVVIARKYSSNYDQLMSNIQVGNVALIRAVDYFNLDYNTRFSTYAVPIIARDIKSFVHKDKMIQIPIDSYKDYVKVMNLISEYNSKNISWDNLMIAKSLGMSEKKVSFLIGLTSILAKTNVQEDTDDDIFETYKQDYFSIDKKYEYELMQHQLRQYIDANLNDEEKEFIMNYYYYDMSLKEIANKTNSTIINMYKKHEKILRKLRKVNSKERNKLLEAYDTINK